MLKNRNNGLIFDLRQKNFYILDYQIWRGKEALLYVYLRYKHLLTLFFSVNTL